MLRLLLSGWLVAIPFAGWAWRDISRFERRRWVGLAGSGAWLGGLGAAYLCGGWPAIAVALAWRTGMTREAFTGWPAGPTEIEIEIDLTDPDTAGAADASPPPVRI